VRCAACRLAGLSAPQAHYASLVAPRQFGPRQIALAARRPADPGVSQIFGTRRPPIRRRSYPQDACWPSPASAPKGLQAPLADQKRARARLARARNVLASESKRGRTGLLCEAGAAIPAPHDKELWPTA
jgi:hypothetical protein